MPKDTGQMGLILGPKPTSFEPKKKKKGLMFLSASSNISRWQLVYSHGGMGWKVHLESEFVPAGRAALSHGDVWELGAEESKHILPLIYLVHNLCHFRQHLYSAGSERQGEVPACFCAEAAPQWEVGWRRAMIWMETGLG